MLLKQILRLVLLFIIAIPIDTNAQINTYQKDSTAIAKMQAYILENSICFEDLRTLCKTIGNRISGSEAAAKAVEWGKQALRNAGADKIYVQPVMVPHWVRGTEEFAVKTNNGKSVSFHPLGLGNSIGTDNAELANQIVEVRDMQELEKLGIENINGKIVFFNHPWNQHISNPFNEYGNSVYYRWAGPSLAAKFGATACIIRSAGSGYDNFAHTGSMKYDSNYKKIPAMSLSFVEANELEKLIRSKQITKATVRSTSHFEAEVLSYNVIGEIVGGELKDEIITVGGHLDSWDIGEGAHDDGAGCVQSIEIIRAFKKTGIKPRRTIRCVLFMNEENGLRGGNEYARLAVELKEKHTCAIETDAGGFSPRGFSMSCSKAQRAYVQNWKKLFYPLGLYDFDEEGGGADISPLHKNLGTPVMELSPDPQRYFDLHHTANDVFEQVNRRELSMGALALASMVYMISEYGMSK
jgi:carboxypeptidase Q